MNAMQPGQDLFTTLLHPQYQGVDKYKTNPSQPSNQSMLLIRLRQLLNCFQVEHYQFANNVPTTALDFRLVRWLFDVLAELCHV